MNALILTLILGLYLISAVFVIRVSIIHPAVLFISMFFLNALMLFLWTPKVPDLRWNTIKVVSISCAAFLLFSTMKFQITGGRNVCKVKRLSAQKISYINYSKKLALMFLIVDLAVIAIYVKTQRDIVGKLLGSSGLSLADTMGQYSGLVKFSTKDASLPAYIKLAVEIVYASGFVLGYIQINNYVCNGKKEISNVLMLDIGLCLLLSLLSGSRSGAVRLIIGLITMFFLIQEKVSKKKAGKYVRYVIFIGVLTILSFKEVGNLLGRQNERPLFDTIFMYIGGPIKNLDLFLNSKHQIPDLFGKMTFASQYRNIANLTGNPKYLYQLSVFSYGIVNSVDLGNVYTALTALIYDFGETAAVMMVIIMAFISAVIYRKAKSQIGKKPAMWVFTYSFLTYFILMSGFAEKFYGIILSINFYRHLFYFYALYKIFVKKSQSYQNAGTYVH